MQRTGTFLSNKAEQMKTAQGSGDKIKLYVHHIHRDSPVLQNWHCIPCVTTDMLTQFYLLHESTITESHKFDSSSHCVL